MNKIEIDGVEFIVKSISEKVGNMTCGIPKSGVRFEADGVSIEIDYSRSTMKNRNIGVKLLEYYIKLIKEEK